MNWAEVTILAETETEAITVQISVNELFALFGICIILAVIGGYIIGRLPR